MVAADALVAGGGDDDCGLGEGRRRRVGVLSPSWTPPAAWLIHPLAIDAVVASKRMLIPLDAGTVLAGTPDR